MLGNLSEDELPIEVALPLYSIIVQKRLNELNVSQNNWFTKSTERNVSSSEINLGIEDFGSLVQVKALAVNSVGVVEFLPIRVVAFEALEDFRRSGQAACAVYGLGNEAKLKFSQSSYLPAKVRIYYEPYKQLNDGYESDNPIPANYLSMINLETAVLCAPHVRNTSESQARQLQAIVALYQEQVREFEKTWSRMFDAQAEHRAYSKRRYSRRRFGGN